MSVLGYWHVNKDKYKEKLFEITDNIKGLNIFKTEKDYIKIIKNKAIINDKYKERKTEKVKLESVKVNLVDNIRVKLFSTGALSFYFEFELELDDRTFEIKTKNCIDLINYPNLVVGKKIEDYEKEDNTLDFKLKIFKPGLLNIISYEVAKDIFYRFMESLKKNVKSKDLKIQKIDPYYDVNDLVVANRYNKKLYTKDDYKNIYAQPYVGILIQNLPIDLGDLPDKVTDSKEFRTLSQILVALASQTKEFLFRFPNPVEYFKNNNITRGVRDAIIIERRGFAAIGVRKEPPSKDEKHDDHEIFYYTQFRLNAFKTIIFCIESIFATTKSVTSFNKELAEFVSNKINKLLSRRICQDTSKIQPLDNEYFEDLAKLVEILSKARTLSPCEDFSTNIIPSLKSHIAIEGSKKLKSFALDSLVEVAHHRLDNYGHFLRTSFNVNDSINSNKALENSNKALERIENAVKGIYKTFDGIKVIAGFTLIFGVIITLIFIFILFFYY